METLSTLCTFIRAVCIHIRVLVESQLESQLLHHVWSGVFILPLGRPVFGRKGLKCMLLLIWHSMLYMHAQVHIHTASHTCICVNAAAHNID